MVVFKTKSGGIVIRNLVSAYVTSITNFPEQTLVVRSYDCGTMEVTVCSEIKTVIQLPVFFYCVRLIPLR